MTHHRGGIRRHSFLRVVPQPPIDDCPDYVVINGEKVCLDTGLVTESPSGTLEKTNPLPAGRYWIDVFGKNIPAMNTWFQAFAEDGVHVDVSQQFQPTPEQVILEKGPFASSDDIQSMIRNFYIFTYTPTNGVPVTWEQTTFGYPTIAGANVKSSDDTVQKPDLPLDPLNELQTFSESLAGLVGVTSKAGAIALTAGLFIGVGYGLVEYLKSKRKRK